MDQAQEKFEMGPIQKEWVRRLRAHPERQMKGRLGRIENLEDGDYQACCLGEAVLLLCSLDKSSPVVDDGKLRDCGLSVLPSTETRNRLGLRSVEGNLKSNFLKGDMVCTCLSDMNDSGVTWPEIADYIESNPENVFTKSV